VSKAKRDHSKECRSDFVRRVQFFAGNASEPTTLEGVLTGLDAAPARRWYQDDATPWRSYIMLTELESAFRSPKTDLGLRAALHRMDRRVEGHLFTSALAYRFVHTLRLQLKANGVNDS